MGVRTKVDINIEVGGENDLSNCLFGRELSELLDSMDDEKNETGLLAAGETNRSVDLGDIDEVRLVYIEAEGEIDVSFGAGAPTGAVILGVGGSFPTGFVGGEAMTVEIDNLGAVAIAFTVGASTAQDVCNEINAAFALAGILSGGVPVSPATVVGGEVQLASPTTGITSEVEIAAIDAAVDAALGMAASTVVGAAAEPGTAQYSLMRMGNTGNESAVSGLKSFLLATLQATAVLLTNPSTTTAVAYRVCVVGDLVST